MKNKKFSAFIKFEGKNNGYMEFSNSIDRLRKLILATAVTKVIIYEQKLNRKLITLTSQIHI